MRQISGGGNAPQVGVAFSLQLALIHSFGVEAFLVTVAVVQFIDHRFHSFRHDTKRHFPR